MLTKLAFEAAGKALRAAGVSASADPSSALRNVGVAPRGRTRRDRAPVRGKGLRQAAFRQAAKVLLGDLPLAVAAAEELLGCFPPSGAERLQPSSIE